MGKMLALLAAYRKTPTLIDFAHWLMERDFDLIASEGTAVYLEENGLSAIRVSDWIGTKPIMDHLVATLSTQIHAALLCDRSNPAHLAELEKLRVSPIDLAFVDMYPIDQAIRDALEKQDDDRQAIEGVRKATDIGGPTIIRAAAKGRRFVLPGYPHINTFKAGFWPDYTSANEERRAYLLDFQAAAAERAVADYVSRSADFLLRLSNKYFEEQAAHTPSAS